MTKYSLALIITFLTWTQLFGQFALLSTTPETNSSDVPVNQAVILQFSDIINANTSVADFSVISNFRGKIAYTFSIAGNALTLTPSAVLQNGETITVSVFTSLKSAGNISLGTLVNINFLVESQPSPRTPPTLLSADIVSSGGINTMIGAADMDGDNDLDAIAFLGPNIVWLENDGTGKFTKHTVKTGVSSPGCLKAFDFDRDGDMDVLASGYSGLMILVNDGNQNFTLETIINGFSIVSFDLADFDSDGLIDIVYGSVESIAGSSVPGTYILYNQGSYIFNKVKIRSSTFYQYMCVDLDNDHDWDIVHYDDTGVHYFLNSEGVFTSHTIFTDDNTVYEDVQIADVNNDHHPDIVFLKYRFSTFSLEVWSNDGSLNFTSHKIELDHIVELSSIADYDGDDDQDLMIIDGNYRYSMLENAGSWSFAKKAVAQALPDLYYPSNSVSADFDQDGDLDLLVSPTSMIKLYKNMVYPVEDTIIPGIKVISEADADWGDYDNDGDLDLISTGYFEGGGITIVYENQNGTMVEKALDLPALWLGSCDWGDYDNDGDLDILLTGASSLETDDRSPQSFIYTNTGAGFALLASSAVQLPKIWYGEARWADLNNDGSLDIVFNGAYYAGVYQGDGNGNFVKKIDFPFAASWANLDTGDFDNDGDLDIAVSGYTGGAILGVFRNDGDWEFSTISGDFIARLGGNVSWADMDNDGDLDLVASGTTRNESGNGVSMITVYQNTGSGFAAITNSEFIYQADADGTTSVGDFDNDGVSDMVASTQGGSSFEPSMNLFKNSGTGDLTRMDIILPNIATHLISWVDFDHDHDLDLFFRNRLLVNNVSKKNTIPERPAVMEVDSVYNNSIYFSWTQGKDNETPDSGLSYEIYVGTTASNQDVVSPASHINTGLRKVIGKGNWNTNHAHVADLAGGDYFFGVQSIDPSFESSAFTDQDKVFVIGIHGSIGACPGSEYTYSAEPSGAYDWEVVGGTIISGQGTGSLMVRWNTVGKGFVKVSSTNGNRNTLPVYVEETPLPDIEGLLTVCTGLVKYTNTDALSHHTVWTVSGVNLVVSESLNEGTVDWQSNGGFNLIATAYPKHNGCHSNDTIQVQVDQRPVLEIEGPYYTCTEQAIEYSVVAANASWNVVNGSIISNSVQSIQINWPVSGDGYVIASVQSQRAYCTIVDSLSVVIKQSPAKPILTVSGDTIFSSPSPNDIYTWYYNNELVITGPYIGVLPHVQGEFVVEVFNTEGCGRKSNPLIFLITAIDEYPIVETKENSLLIYPNPADSEITAEFTNDYLGKTHVFIYGSTGELIKEFTIQKTDKLLQHTIDVSSLKAGHYILIIKTDHDFYSTKLIKRD